jgi:release factor glutamine methyltransferase
MSTMRLLDALRSSTEYLEKARIEDAFADSEILVLHAAQVERLAAYMENPEISKGTIARIRRLIRRRAKGEPVQYIVGQVEFLGLKIYVGKGVLIPRPETELLAEEAIKTVSGVVRPVRVLDLCTGSGCVALAIAKVLSDATVVGTDVSKKALHYARKNARENSVDNVTFLTGSLFSPLKPGIYFDLIVSNPPYVKRSDIRGLQREIREWEPLKALDGGDDGLDFYVKIFSDAGGYLKEGGKIMVELGFGQAAAVSEIARGAGFKNVEARKDYAGIERILKAGL